MGHDTMHSPHETQVESPIGKIVVEGDASLISLAASGQHPVVANGIAATNATIAEDAGFVIDRDGQGGIVVTARRTAPGKTRMFNVSSRRQVLPVRSRRSAVAGRRGWDGLPSAVPATCA